MRYKDKWTHGMHANYKVKEIKDSTYCITQSTWHSRKGNSMESV